METKATPAPEVKPAAQANTLTVSEWAKKVGLTPKAARRQLRAGSIAGATKDGGEWNVPVTAKPAERKVKESKPVAKPAAKSAKAPKAKAAKKITVKKVAKESKPADAK